MKLEKEIKKIIDILPPSYEDLVSRTGKNFSNANSFIQHIPGNVDEAQSKFMAICRREIDYDTYDDSKKKIHRQGIIGRYLDDSGNVLLYRNWHRFMCIDEKYREWEQPHFSIYYPKYEDVAICINGEIPELKAFFRDRKLEQILD